MCDRHNDSDAEEEREGESPEKFNNIFYRQSSNALKLKKKLSLYLKCSIFIQYRNTVEHPIFELIGRRDHLDKEIFRQWNTHFLHDDYAIFQKESYK